MKAILPWVLLTSIPALISADFIIADLKHQKKRSVDGHPTKQVKELEIYSFKVDCKITSRFARNVVTSRVVNRANESKEALFDVQLPKTAFIANFSMIIDGVVYVGVVKEKEVAKQQYQQAVARGQTAGLVKVTGRKMEKFKVSVNIAAAKKVTFELVYEELLKRKLGKYEMVIRVKPEQLVQHFQIDVHLFEPQGIAFLDVNATFLTNDLMPIVKKTLTGKKAHISFTPTLDQQSACTSCQNTGLDGDFIMTYDVDRDLSAGNIAIVNGYFVHHFGPANLPRVPKNVVFVIDQSGSMMFTKMFQTKEALHKILDDLNTEDNFAFISFSSSFRKWKNSLIRATTANVVEAHKYVSELHAGGGTNINDPLLEAAKLLDDAHNLGQVPERSVSMIILLTDGDPNSGESNPTKIQSNVKYAINNKYNLYCLGFGYDVKYSFLEKMSIENSGIARRIYEDSDAALQLQGFYNEVANPLLLNVELQYSQNAVSDVTRSTFKQYYDGSEIVVAGRIADNDLDMFVADIRAQDANSNITMTYEVSMSEVDNITQQQQYIFGDFTERMWAYLTIQQLLQQRISVGSEEKKLLTDRARELALKYNFVTPLTSMIVTKPEEQMDQGEFLAEKPVEGDRPHQAQKYHSPSHSRISGSYHSTSGSYHSTSVDSDPHFLIAMRPPNDAVCFNIDEKPGVILNLVTDPVTGFVVNGELIGDKKTENNKKVNTYFGKFGLVYNKMELRMEITTQEIKLFHGADITRFPWSATATSTHAGFAITINKERNLIVTMGVDVTFVILLHRVWKNHPLHQDFLGFYTLDNHRFSSQTLGLLGQFYHPIDAEVFNIRPGFDQGKVDATMFVKGHKLTVTRGNQKDYRLDPKHGTDVPCWFVHNSGKGFIDGNHTDYIVSTLFDPINIKPV
ncbi:inter-alpha-trypsin inhibitor heavy chain H3 isoform X4 [Callorhinchus milii]|uniref:inter-alpha-trypsin inhibitor heavy chain H3 isoform X4 n=1 Tax=Callorhinchus milii TaxID=7868 RepID=UPI001C3F573A|nr:inter-alpha-trypsin inhibitor heavy chain H3 isoform X4 [Callorhinchus milii]